MSDIKLLRKQLNNLKNHHYELDRTILHLTAQKFDAEAKKNPHELNQLKDLKKKKLLIRDQIFNIQKQLQKYED
tara:strand:+ start:223 stop:444 length:222 start_codon:yes stop_codon:yes gene_type:complete